MAYAAFLKNSGKNLTFVSVAQGAAGTTVIAAGVAGKKIKVVSAVLVLDVAGSLKFTDDSADLTGAMPLSATGGFVLPPGQNNYFETATGAGLNIVSVTGKASGVIGIITGD